MKLQKRLAAAALALLMGLSSAGCASGSDTEEKVDTKRYDEVSYSSDIEESGTVCENSRWQLNWDDDNKRVSFVEKATGAVWGTTPQEACTPQVDEEGDIKKNHAQVESALHVYYHNPTNVAEEIILSYNDAVSDGEVYAQKIDNGLRVIYDFINYEIIVPVDYIIEDDRFLVTVDPTQIADNGEEYVTAVSLAPFLCGLKNGSEDSWLFMPDGSGAIVRPYDRATVGESGLSRVYGDDLTIQKHEFTSVLQQTYMPVYGVKKGDNGLFAIIESGAEEASIGWNVGSSNIAYSSVYAQFSIRGYNSVTPPRGFSTPAAFIKVFDDSICTTPLSVAYYPLSGEKASVMGMAETYQAYLTAKGELKQSQTEEKSASFKYVGGTVQPDFFLGIPTSKLYPLTTTEQAATMTGELAETLGNDFLVDLVGFGASGINTGKYAGNYTTASNLGGKKGMRSLAAKMAELDLPWYMDFDMISFKSGSSAKGAVWPNQQSAYFYQFNTVSRMNYSIRTRMIARSRLAESITKLTDKASSMDLTGISLDSLSHVIYSDYKTEETKVCKGMSEAAVQAFDQVKQAGYSTLADSANLYAALAADAVIDAPIYSSQYDITSQDVPFYQLVLRGYVPMSSVSINLCANEQDALLRCVEAGISPSYTLTYNYDNELVTSYQSFIFGSSYSGNKTRILEQISSVKEYLSSIKGAKIADYTALSEDVRITRFDNGVYVAVNYGDAEASTAYGSVPAGGWITGRVAQ